MSDEYLLASALKTADHKEAARLVKKIAGDEAQTAVRVKMLLIIIFAVLWHFDPFGFKN